MSSRRVKQQLAALEQRQRASDSLHNTSSAPKKKRLRPRQKRKTALNTQKEINAEQQKQRIVEKNLLYYQATTHSKATAQAAAVMTEVTLGSWDG